MTLFSTFQTFQDFAMAAGVSLIFGIIGITLLVIGFKAFDKLTPKLDLEGELAKGNIAVGIIVAALLLAISLIVSHAISG